MPTVVLLLHHLDHRLDFIEHHLTLRRDVLCRLDRACGGDAPSIVDVQADLLKDEGVRGDDPRDTLNFDVDIGDVDAHCVEDEGKSKACTGDIDDRGVGGFATPDALVH